MPAASTPGIALTRARICWKMALRFAGAGFGGRSGVVVIHPDGGGAFGLEAQIDVEHFQEAAQQQACANQQHAGQGDFRNHQRGAEALVFAAQARARAGVLEHFLQVAAGNAQSREPGRRAWR